MTIVAVDVFEDDVFEDNVFADFTSDYVDRLDLLQKIVFLKTDVTTVHPTDHIYPEVRGIRRVDESLRVMDMPVTSQGNEVAGAGVTPRRAVFNNGWRLGIENPTNGTLQITGEMISDDGLAGSQIVKLDFLPEGVSMLVNYEPSEINSLATLEQAVNSVPADVWADLIAQQLIANVNATKTAAESADTKIDSVPDAVWTYTRV